jgi:hypothetical protein
MAIVWQSQALRTRLLTTTAQDPFLAMERGDASTRTHPPDASTLGVTAFNVGMLQAISFAQRQDEKVAELAGHVKRWLEEGPAVVGLNEIAPSIAKKLVEKLKEQKLDVDIATSDSNSLLWRTPQ